MLKELLINLFQETNGNYPSTEELKRIDSAIEDNDFLVDSKVPSWIMMLLRNVVDGRQTPKTFYQSMADHGDVNNFLSDLEAIIKADWNDYGEAVEIKFSKLGLLVYISREDNFFEIKTLG